MKFRIADLFCKAGGGAMGYHRAGFEVIGIDTEPQKNYPFKFYQADAITYPLKGFDAVHASPPCQKYSALVTMHPGQNYPDLIDVTREKLKKSGLPYIIENVETSPLSKSSDLFGSHGVLLCGSMFNLGCERGYLKRHRIFETSFPLPQLHCIHRGRAVGVYGHGGCSKKHRMLYKKEAAEAMQINWMNRDELAQAIPPAYTKWIGEQLMKRLKY